MEYITTLGLVGAGSILFSFGMNQIGKWSRDDFVYDAVNAFGALLLTIYSYLIVSYPFMLLNIVWFLIAVKDLSWRNN
jgi:hypothetical protein